MFRALDKLRSLMGATGAPAFARIRPVYGTMAITQRDTGDTSPVNSITAVAHPGGTDVLNPPAGPVVAGPGPFGGYYRVPGFIQDGAAREITFGDSEMIVPSDGVYLIPVGWGGFRHSANNATVGFVLGIERAGQIFFSQRPTAGLKPNIGQIGNISGGGQVAALAGDKLSVWVATNSGGTIVLGNGNVSIHMLEDTTP